jgi:hypothetical protein
MPGAFRPLAVSLAHNIDNNGEVKSVNVFEGACLKARVVFLAISGEKMATECKQWAKKRRIRGCLRHSFHLAPRS